MAARLQMTTWLPVILSRFPWPTDTIIIGGLERTMTLEPPSRLRALESRIEPANYKWHLLLPEFRLSEYYLLAEMWHKKPSQRSHFPFEDDWICKVQGHCCNYWQRPCRTFCCIRSPEGRIFRDNFWAGGKLPEKYYGFERAKLTNFE